jgi:3-phenylpropionate/trans-cinnamate dioxygenase ferredoxin component
LASHFVRVCTVDEVVDGFPTAVTVPGSDDEQRVVVRVGDDIYALSGVCPHQAADLSEGIVENGVLWCPVHSSGFDCRTGAALHPPAPGPLRAYAVSIEGDDVYVSVEPGL